MEKLRSEPLRRWRAEWAPTAWDLGVPVDLDTHFMPSDAPIRAWLLRMYAGRADCLDGKASPYRQGFVHGVLLYPHGFVQLRRTGQFYDLPESLKGQVWSLWEGCQQWPRHEAQTVSAKTLEQEWRRYKTPGSPPQLSDSAIAWVVTFDGDVFELRSSDFIDTRLFGADDQEDSAQPILELPETMTSFLLELHTKGRRRFHKQSILGACVVFASCALATTIPSSEPWKSSDTFDIRQLVWAIPFLVGLYQWFAGRYGIRQAQLAQAVSRGTYRDPRLNNGRSSGRLAPWFYWSILKHAVVAAIVPLGLATVIIKFGLGQNPFAAVAVFLCLFAAAALIVVDAVAFGLMTDTHGEPFGIQRWR